MNAKTAKMLRKIQANDKRSKKLWNGLTAEKKARVRAAYMSNDRKPGKALVAFGEAIGNIT